MRTALYRTFQRRLISLTLFASLAPFLLLGAISYYPVASMYERKTEEQIKYRAAAQAEAVDLFLKERTAILCAMADTHSLEDMLNPKTLLNVLNVMNARAGAFVDLGVIDSQGQHLTYVGPYDLEGLNYFNHPWFAEVMSRGVHVSDVFMGYRQIPHFIIAVRRQEQQGQWILRATIDPDVFGGMVRAAQVGRTGDAYILNRDGFFQTRPRFNGNTLNESRLETTLFGSRTTVIQMNDDRGRKTLYAASWLKNNAWLLVISQEVAEEMRELVQTRNVEAGIIGLGILAIVLTTVITARQALGRFRETDREMNELNAQLIQSDKLAALGKLAAGVAHEINNPLAVIIQKTGWMEDLLSEEEFQKTKNLEEFRNSLHKIEEHVERARKVVHGMLGYARKMEPRLEDVDVNQVVVQTIGLLENYARINSIEIRTQLSPELPIIASDQSQLQQVFLNIISNAIDAVGKGGAVLIESRRVGDGITASVTDNGPGIPEEAQKRVFDPFFTTKAAGKGTGLGLWVSYNIMEKLGGKITLKSELGKGSTFTVEVPVVYPEKK